MRRGSGAKRRSNSVGNFGGRQTGRHSRRCSPDSPLEGSGFEPLVPRSCEPIRSQPCVITTLPKCPRPSKWRYASFASANGNARSITGRKRCIAIARFMASKSTRLPTLIAPSVIPRPVSNKGSRPAPGLREARSDQAEMSAHGQSLQRHCNRSRSADLNDAIDAAGIGQLTHLLVPIRRLGIVDHLRCTKHPQL